ncbi:MAG: homoserine kinase [Deltaproteobacteria bacterium]|nr:homoserine kinase [Deltaproteobacteria bacterium]
MTVHTELTRDEIADWIRLYEVGDLRQCEPTRGTSANTNYDVTTEQGRFVLRVNEGKSFRDLIYEKDLLLYLAERDLGAQTPRIVANCINGHFTPVADGKYASLFERLGGRALASWEVAAEHCSQVGCFLARLHRAGHGFVGHRRNPHRPAQVDATLAALGQPEDAVRPFVERARRAQRQLRRALAQRLPRSLLHGGLTPDNTKFARGRLTGVLDFETGACGPQVYDLAVAINGWCWAASGLAEDRCRALLSAYRAVQPLTDRELRLLPDWTRFATLRQAVAWLVAYEPPQRRGVTPGLYRDFRHHARRLDDLDHTDRREFRRICAI